MGEAELSITGNTIRFDYDREDFAHDLINAYRDLFDSNEQMLSDLNQYLDSNDINELVAKHE